MGENIPEIEPYGLNIQTQRKICHTFVPRIFFIYYNDRFQSQIVIVSRQTHRYIRTVYILAKRVSVLLLDRG